MQKAGSIPPTCYFPDPDSSIDYNPRQYEQALEYLAICDVECGIRASIQHLITEPNPQQAMLEVIRLLRDIDWTHSDIVEFAVLNDIEMALLPEKRESRRETALEIVYRQDLPSEEKAYHLYQLHNAVSREVAEGRKERHHVSLDEMNQIKRRVLRQPEADQYQ